MPSALSPPSRAVTARRSGALDGLRGFAALAVVSSHLTGSMGLLPYASGGFIGVLVFFALSGYLIGAISWRGVASWSGYRRFLARRVQRLAPVMVALVVVVVPLMLTFAGQDLADTVLQAGAAVTQTTAFLVTAGHGGHPVWGPTWSLTVEWVFYLAFPLCLMLARRRGVTSVVAARLSFGAAAALYLIGLALPPKAFYLLPVANLGVMVAGAALALTHHAETPGEGRRPEPARAWFGLTLLLLFTVLPGSSLGLGYRLVVLPSVALATLVVIHGCRSEGAVGRLLGTRLVTAVGLRAYSVYIWHMPVFWLTWTHLPALSAPARCAVAVVLLVPVVWVSFRLLEQPWLSGRRRESSPGPQRETAPGAPTVGAGLTT